MSYENIEKLGKPSILEDYGKLSPRHQRIVAWTIKEYLEIEEKSNERISVEVWTVDAPMDRPITNLVNSPNIFNIKRRGLENLDKIDFDFGLLFTDDGLMPFFAKNDIALFSEPPEDIEDGDMCLLKDKYLNNWYIAFKEESGFFELDGAFLDKGDAVTVVGVLVNIYSK